MKSRVLLFALLAGVLVAIPLAASAIPSPPFETNTSCLECHDVAAGGPVFSTVDFSAASVDRTKCSSCHWVQNHYPHGSFSQCNSCHYTMPTRTDFYNSNVSTPYGFFSSALSPSLDPALIHEAHVNGSWPKGVTTNPVTGQPVYCASCHAPAACDACHGAVSHGNHTAPAPGDPYPGVTRTVARGATPAQYSTLNTTVRETSRCINPFCHDVAGVPGAVVRRQFEENSPIAVYTPAWITELATAHSGGQAFYTDRAGRKVDITVTGPGIVRIYGPRNIRGGLADITVDGGPATRIDYFSSATQYNVLMFQTDDLSAGTHTITITALGLRSPGSIANRVYLDVVRVLNLTGAGFEPDCTDCHAENIVTHGYDSVDHVADVGAASNPGEPACGTCHEMDVLTEHEKGSSSSAGGTCGTCHPAPRDTYGAWDQTCEQGGCHAAGSATGKHTEMAADHTPPAAGVVCADCHPGDLGAVHVEASVTDSAGTRTTCNVCHTVTTVPTTNDCTVCHFTFDGHYDTAVHTSTWTLATCDGAGCHTTRDLMGAHVEKDPAFTCFGCHSSADSTVQAAITAGDTACGTCHTSVSQTASHRAVHWANPPLVGGVTPTPYYSYYTGTAGTAPTRDCAGCHVSNLVDEHMGVFENNQWTRVPRTDSVGATLTCATCHSSFDPATVTAIALGQTKCDACHVVHGPIGKVHRSTYVTDPDIDCSGCHSSDLTVVHNGYMTTTTPSGRVLAGCDMCH
ncbi:MAG: hypothetical protein U1E22_05310, partial [Coriobacteriia bacterium]|nr:hypothetical protein [Coriobacteriia bacterium]